LTFVSSSFTTSAIAREAARLRICGQLRSAGGEGDLRIGAVLAGCGF